MTNAIASSGCSMPMSTPLPPSGSSTQVSAGGPAAAQAAIPVGAGGDPLAGVLQALMASLQQLTTLLQGGAVGSALGGTLAGGGMGSPVQAGGSLGSPVQAGGSMTGMSHAMPIPPRRHDPRFLDESVGPKVKKGKAKTLKIPDGPGFHGAKGRKQNADDKSKNNYSVTDANFSNQLGLLPKDPDTGKKMTYVQHIQTYAAANYIETYNHPLYEKLMANQNAGKGTILGAAAHIMGLVKTADPAEAGVTQADLAALPMTIPGTPMDAKAYVASGKDITGQDWARPHHAGSQFKVMSQLISAGVNWKDAMVLAGDDGISGSGRVNGVNGQNGNTGFNAGEREIWAKAAKIQQKTGINVIQIMIGGHNHLGLDKSALTNPNINKLIGANKSDRSASDDRANLIYAAFRSGRIKGNASAEGTKADNKHLLNHATGPVMQVQPAMNMSGMTMTGSSAH